MRTPLAGSPRVPAQGQSAQGEPAPKVRAKAVIDGNQVNIPGPAGSDEYRKLSVLIGLDLAVKVFQEITPAYGPYPKPTQVGR